MMYSPLQPAILMVQTILPKKNARKTVSMDGAQKTVALVKIKIRHVMAIRHRVKEPAGKTVLHTKTKAEDSTSAFFNVLY